MKENVETPHKRLKRSLFSCKICSSKGINVHNIKRIVQ